MTRATQTQERWKQYLQIVVRKHTRGEKLQRSERRRQVARYDDEQLDSYLIDKDMLVHAKGKAKQGESSGMGLNVTGRGQLA